MTARRSNVGPHVVPLNDEGRRDEAAGAGRPGPAPRGAIVECRRAVELLPWLLNATLEAQEEQTLRAHVDACHACQAELADAHDAWALGTGHLPASALVDYAFGPPGSAAQRARVEAHVAVCPTCAEELALTRQAQHELAQDDESEGPVAAVARGPATPVTRLVPRRVTFAAPARPRNRRTWTAWAAGLAVAAAAFGYWAGTQRAGVERETGRQHERSLSARVAEPGGPSLAPAPAAPGAPAGDAAALEGARREIARLRRRLAAFATPQLNPHVVELLPRLGRGALRSSAPSDEPANIVDLPPGASAVTFVLVREPGSPPGPCEVELRDSTGRVVWGAHGLSAHAGGDFTLTLPAAFVPQERFQLLVFARAPEGRRPLARYDVERHAR